MPFFFRVASFHVVEERCHFDSAPRLSDIVYDSSTGRAHACAETGRDVSHIQATVCIESEAREAVTQVSSGKDPVAAIECALRHALLQIFPQVQTYLLYWYKSTNTDAVGDQLQNVHMLDFRVRTLRDAQERPSGTQDRDSRKMWTKDGSASRGDDGEEEGSSGVRVMVECTDGTTGTSWRTIGVSNSVLDAFALAYCDAMLWRLLALAQLAPPSSPHVRAASCESPTLTAASSPAAVTPSVSIRQQRQLSPACESPTVAGASSPAVSAPTSPSAPAGASMCGPHTDDPARSSHWQQQSMTPPPPPRLQQQLLHTPPTVRRSTQQQQQQQQQVSPTSAWPCATGTAWSQHIMRSGEAEEEERKRSAAAAAAAEYQWQVGLQQHATLETRRRSYSSYARLNEVE